MSLSRPTEDEIEALRSFAVSQCVSISGAALSCTGLAIALRKKAPTVSIAMSAASIGLGTWAMLKLYAKDLPHRGEHVIPFPFFCANLVIQGPVAYTDVHGIPRRKVPGIKLDVYCF